MSESTLTVSELIGRGSHRECWVHPQDPRLCIKTARNAEDDCYQSKADVFNFRRSDEKGLVGIHVPRIHGWVSTNRGKGLVSERILDDCGTPSPTLAQAAKAKLIDATEAEQLVLEVFNAFLSRNVILRDAGPVNMLVRFNQVHGRHLVVVDGVGHSAMGLKEYVRDALPVFGRYRTKKELWITRKRLIKLFAAIDAEDQKLENDRCLDRQRRAA